MSKSKDHRWYTRWRRYAEYCVRRGGVPYLGYSLTLQQRKRAAQWAAELGNSST